MRITRLAVASAATAAFVTAFAAPASASFPVTVEFQGPIECVTDPCDQPTPVVVCVVPVDVCTPR